MRERRGGGGGGGGEAVEGLAPALVQEGNPYLAARRELESVFGDLARGKRNWQVMSFALAGLLGLVLVGYLRVSGEARVTPYVVEVDRLGQAVAFGPAERWRRTDTRLVAYQLALLVRNLRFVSSDLEAEKELLFAGYAYVTGAAHATLDEYFTNAANDPRVLGRSLTRQVEVTSVLQVPRSSTWKVSWREVERPRVAGSERRTAWEAYLRVEMSPPRTVGGVLANPLGLYVTEINWTQVAQGGS
jgi:type IV secretory pathway TrbF-like protein